MEGALTIWATDTDDIIDEFDMSLPALEEVGKEYVITGDFGKLLMEHKADIQVGAMMRVYGIKVTDLELNGVHTVGGDFSIDTNRNLKNLKLGSLTTVDKAMNIKQNQALEKVSLPKLKTIKGDMAFTQNPALEKMDFAALEFAGTISITSNGKKPSVSFPYLKTLGNGNTTSTSTFEDVGEIQFASLRNITGAVVFESTNLDDLTIPLLKTVTGSITVKGNPSLETLALPRATSVEELTIRENDKLGNVTANAIKSAGIISVRGPLKNVEFFGLEEVTGDFKISGDDSLDCSWFDANIRKLVKGTYYCQGDHDKKDSKPTTGGIEDTEGNPEDYITSSPVDDDNDSGSGSSAKSSDGDDSSEGQEAGSSKTGLSTGAKAGIAVGVIAAAAVVLLLFLLWRRRRFQQGPAQQRVGSSGGSDDEASNPFANQLGVHTKIEATNPSPSLGTLNFGRTSLLESTNGMAEKGPTTWKTIRRVSHSSGESTAVVKD